MNNESSPTLGTIVRLSLLVGGLVLLVLSWPVARGAVLFQKTDAFYARIGAGKPYTIEEWRAALAIVDAAIAADPSSMRYAQRSELFGVAAATRALKVSDEQRRAWLLQAKADVERGLRNDPAHAVEWQRLAVTLEWLEGPSNAILPPLFMAIDMGRMSSPLWAASVRLILDNWGSLTDEQKQRMGDYIAMIWRKSPDRRFFGTMVYGPIDEVILRMVLQNEPKALDELTMHIKEAQKWKK